MKHLPFVLTLLLAVSTVSALEAPLCSEPLRLEIGSESLPFGETLDREVGAMPLGLEMDPGLQKILQPPAVACTWISCTVHSTCRSLGCGLCGFEEGLPWGHCGLF